MLAQLKIKDFAIIDDLKVDFSDNMTVLTGETGSGKSIIIDAINLLLGERASNEMIRFDKEKAIVEGLFYFENKKLAELLIEYGIDASDDSLIIYREISRNGRNLCRLNGNLITVSQLKQIGSLLVDVHVQHDTQRLIKTNNYLYLIDNFCDNEFHDELKEYQEALAKYNSTLKEYEMLISENKTNQEKLDFYEFQQNEFKQANISLNEYEELQEKRNQYVNYDKVFESLRSSHQLLEANRVLENIYESSNYLSRISSISTKYNEISETLLSNYYQLDDLKNLIASEIERLDYDPQELDKIESRLNVYSTLKRKYKLEVEALVEYENELELKMEKIGNFDFLIEELKLQLANLFKNLLSLGLKLREKRKLIAVDIEKKLIEHLKDLKLLNTRFNIVFNEINIDQEDFLNGKYFQERGLDVLDFLVSFNLGEPIKPLSKVASGGELSRFMLGLIINRDI